MSDYSISGPRLRCLIINAHRLLGQRYRRSITVELDRIIDESEVGIAGERLSGNVVKEEFWKGQKSAAEQIKLWMEAQ